MTSLTEKRFSKIEPILQKAIQALKTGGSVVGIDRELEAALGMKYRDLHYCMKDLLKNETYAPVAAIVLENQGPPGFPRAGARIALAKLYGVASYSDPALSEKRQSWYSSYGINVPRLN